jgi:hypothetical protein
MWKEKEGNMEGYVEVYRGMTGGEQGDRLLVTTDESIARSHSKIVVEGWVERSKLKSGVEEKAFYNGKVPSHKVGDIEAWVDKKDLLTSDECEVKKIPQRNWKG